MFEYSLIVPVDLKLRPFDILKKANNILKNASSNIEVVFALNDRSSLFDKIFKKLVKRYDNAKVIANFYTKFISQALLRNKAVKVCSSKYIYLMDVDCFFDEKVSSFCINELKNSKQDFIILPCLYLSRKGSRTIFKSSTEEMFERYVAFRRDLFVSLALPSSCIFMKKEDFFKIGGFNEAFVGRGGEDFEFMIKLALYYKKIPASKDLLINKFYKAPLLSQGFRKELACLSLPYFFEKKVIFHLYHRRFSFFSYFRRYKANAKILNESLEAIKLESKESSSLLVCYENLCVKFKVELDKYFVLFNSLKANSIFDGLWLFLKRL